MLQEHLFLSCFKSGLTERQVHAFAWINPICSWRPWSHCDQQTTTNFWSQGPQSAAVIPASGYSTLATVLMLLLLILATRPFITQIITETLLGSLRFKQSSQLGFPSAAALWVSLPFASFTWLAPGLAFAAPISNPSWSGLHNVSVEFVCHVARTLCQPGWVVQLLLFSQGRVKLTYNVLGNPRVHLPCGTYKICFSNRQHTTFSWSFLHKSGITKRCRLFRAQL